MIGICFGYIDRKSGVRFRHNLKSKQATQIATEPPSTWHDCVAPCAFSASLKALFFEQTLMGKYEKVLTASLFKTGTFNHSVTHPTY